MIDMPSRGFMGTLAEPAGPAQDETQCGTGQGETHPKPVAVTDIELGDYRNRMLTGKTQELSATVLLGGICGATAGVARYFSIDAYKSVDLALLALANGIQA